MRLKWPTFCTSINKLCVDKPKWIKCPFVGQLFIVSKYLIFHAMPCSDIYLAVALKGQKELVVVKCMHEHAETSAIVQFTSKHKHLKPILPT